MVDISPKEDVLRIAIPLTIYFVIMFIGTFIAFAAAVLLNEICVPFTLVPVVDWNEPVIVVLGNRLFPTPKNESPQELDHQAHGNEIFFPQHNEQGALGDKLSPTNT